MYGALELYSRSVSPKLFGNECSFEESAYVVVGAPFDSTATGVPGQRFAPQRIREASVELETFLPDLQIDVERLAVNDAGDLPVLTSVEALIDILGGVAREVLSSGKGLIMLGGDHFSSFPVLVEAAGNVDELGVLVFDAHLDLRDEYPVKCRYSHATVFRRLIEKTKNVYIAYYKPRGWSSEEYEFMRQSPRKLAVLNTREEVESWVKEHRTVYVSIDIDALDPAYAPGTGTPEPIGLAPRELVDSLRAAVLGSEKLLGIDVVEVNPLVDVNNLTSRVAAKILLEALAAMYEARKIGACTRTSKHFLNG